MSIASSDSLIIHTVQCWERRLLSRAQIHRWCTSYKCRGYGRLVSVAHSHSLSFTGALHDLNIESMDDWGRSHARNYWWFARCKCWGQGRLVSVASLDSLMIRTTRMLKTRKTGVCRVSDFTDDSRDANVEDTEDWSLSRVRFHSWLECCNDEATDDCCRSRAHLMPMCLHCSIERWVSLPFVWWFVCYFKWWKHQGLVSAHAISIVWFADPARRTKC